MKQIIEQHTAFEKQAKAKQQELEDIKQQIERIDSTDLFAMTFDNYTIKPQLQAYYDAHSQQLANRVNAYRFDPINKLDTNIINYIRQQADKECNDLFIEFENNPNDKATKEKYYEAFDHKVDELHVEALELLTDYFNAVDDDMARRLKSSIKTSLPKAITESDVETGRESKRRGIPFDYARRTSTRD